MPRFSVVVRADIEGDWKELLIVTFLPALSLVWRKTPALLLREEERIRSRIDLKLYTTTATVKLGASRVPQPLPPGRGAFGFSLPGSQQTVAIIPNYWQTQSKTLCLESQSLVYCANTQHQLETWVLVDGLHHPSLTQQVTGQILTVPVDIVLAHAPLSDGNFYPS